MSRNSSSSISRILIFAFWAAIFFWATEARAATITVNNGGDVTANDGQCTLREAILNANGNNQSGSADCAAGTGNDVIIFAAGLTTVTLTGEIIIANAGTLDINGTGANVLTIDGGAGTNRIFFINTGAVVAVTDVTLTGGGGTGATSGGQGGAIFTRGPLTLNRVHVTGNTAAIFGGGVMFEGSTNNQILNSTFSNNNSPGNGGAFETVFAPITVINSTFSGNTGSANGGAILINGAAATLRSVTVTNNSSGRGGGIFVESNGSLSLGNSIVAGNILTTSSPGVEILRGGPVTSAGYNLVGDSAGDAANTGTAITYQSTDILDTPPQLGPLQLNPPGTTPTHALSVNSPAIDKGSSFGATTDQRGAMRPVQNVSVPDAPGGDAADIGAFEGQATSPASVSVGGRVLSGRGRGIANVRVTLMNATGEMRTSISNPFGYYRFDAVQVGQIYVLTIAAKRFYFENSTRVLFVGDEMREVDFVASP
jgi:CSLREA domain-containing protein